MARPVGGILYIYRNGDLLRLGDGNITITTGDERTANKGVDNNFYFTETPKVASIEAELVCAYEVDLDSLSNATDETITFELNSGKSGVLRNAIQTMPIELNPIDGKFKVKFEGGNIEWTQQ